VSDIKHFLLFYDRELGRLRDIQVFPAGQEAQAAAAYAEAEHRHHAEIYASDPKLEIVLLGADSETTLRTTHSHYFEGGADSRRGVIDRLVARIQELARLLT